MKALTELDDASHGCQQEDKSKLFPVCNQEVSMSQSDAHALSENGCSHAWMFPGTLKTEGSGIPKKRYVPEGTTTSARADFETL